MKRRSLIVAPILAGVLLAGACSSEYSGDELVKELEDAGISSEQANCIVDGMKDAGIPLDKYDEPSSEDQDKIVEITTDCVIGDMGLDLPADGATEEETGG